MKSNVSSAVDNLTFFLWLYDSNDPNNNNSNFAGNNSTHYYGFSVAQAVINFLNLYYQGTIIVVGLLGNGRNAYLFIRNKNKLRSPSYYLAALALADVLFLVTLLILWLTHFGVYLFTHSVFYDIIFYFSSTSSCISAWLIAAFTFERLIVVRYPLKRTKLCTIRRAKIIIVCLTIAAFIIQIVGLLPTGVVAKSSGISIVKDNNRSTRSSSSNSRLVSYRVLIYYEVMRILNMLETGITQVVPPILIVVMNALIIRGLFKFNKTFKTGEIKRHRSTSLSSLKTTHLQRRPTVDIQMKTLRAVTMPCEKRKFKQHSTSHLSVDNDKIEQDGGEAITTLPSRGCVARCVSNSSISIDNGDQNINTFAVMEEHYTIEHLQPLHGCPSPSFVIPPHCLTLELLTAVCDPVMNTNSSSADIVQEIKYEDDAKDVSNAVNKQLENCPISEDNLIEEIQVHTEGLGVLGGIITPALLHSQRSVHHIDMDKIEAADISLPASAQDEIVIQAEPNAILFLNNEATATHHNNTKPKKSGLFRRNGIKVKDRRLSNNRTEYVITKKLVLISTVHILLNLPSYVGNIKHFIDETIGSNSDIEATLAFWYFQQFAMVLYYSSFSVNFLLYPSNTGDSFNVRRLLNRCISKKRQHVIHTL